MMKKKFSIALLLFFALSSNAQHANPQNPKHVISTNDRTTFVEIYHENSNRAFYSWTNAQIIEKLSGISGVKSVSITPKRNFILEIENNMFTAILQNYFNIK